VVNGQVKQFVLVFFIRNFVKMACEVVNYKWTAWTSIMDCNGRKL